MQMRNDGKMTRSAARHKLSTRAALATAGATFGLVGLAGASSTASAATPSITKGGFGGGTVGKVTSVNRKADTFDVKTRSGSSVTVKVSKTTTYRDRSVSKAGFAQVKVGVSVGVTGTTSGKAEAAKSVIIGLSGASAGGGRPQG
jgi:hypothetical protein